ncbi:MAG: DUF2029 domain-containing protein [Phycisphaerales bacterium]|nr:DUF2029 domain-containing protein [Phycisphaerales bacterium]
MKREASHVLTGGRTRWRGYVALAVVILLSRLPFLTPGFGVDADAWRVALTGQRLRAGDAYEPSRLPGAPLYEALAALLAPGGAVALNLASAIASVAVVLVFVRIIRRSTESDPWSAAIALAFTPVFYVQSVSSMDYVWSLLGVLTSLLFAMRGAPLTAGAALGLATGCRLTAIALLPAMLIPLWRQPNRVARTVTFCATAIVTGALCYLPAFSHYGWGFLRVVDHSYPPLMWAVRKGVDVWGQIGIVALGLVALLTLLGFTRRLRGVAPAKNGLLPAAVVGAVISAALFLRLPHEAAYLLPAVAFVIIIAERLIERFTFRVLCLAIVMSSFLALPDGVGPIFRDHQRRVSESRYVRAVMRRMERAPLSEPRDMLIAASWLPRLRYEANRAGRPLATMRVVHLLTREEIEAELVADARVFYLLNAAGTTGFVYGFDLSEAGAIPFPADPVLEEQGEAP